MPYLNMTVQSSKLQHLITTFTTVYLYIIIEIICVQYRFDYHVISTPT